jgi:hypothetical protein
MDNTFIPLSEIQKMFTYSAIKTYRLFVVLRMQGKMREEQDWIMRDNKLLIHLPRFFVELEAKGYKHFLRDEFIAHQTKSPEINLHSNEIIQNQNEIRPHDSTPEKTEELKSPEINSPQMNSDENKRHQMQSDEIEMKSVFRNGEMSETLKAKDEIIGLLKEGMERAERESRHLREANRDLSKQNLDLTKMTMLLIAPQRAEPAYAPGGWRKAQPESAEDATQEDEEKSADAAQQSDEVEPVEHANEPQL